MTRFRVCLPLLGLLLLLAPCAGAQTRRALLIAINHYEPPPGEQAAPGGRKTWSNLNGPLNDVQAMRHILTRRFEFEEKNVHLLLDRDATREAILAAIRRHVIEEPAPGDIVFFFYAGHGSQVRNSKSAESDRLDETLVPADSYKGVWDIRDKELARLFNEAISRGIVLTAAFDSCNSGSNTRGVPRRAATRNALPDPRDAAELEAALPPVGAPPEERGGLFLSAAQDYEPAEESPPQDPAARGVFSSALIDILRSGPVNLSAREVFLQVRARMASEGYTQEPVLAGTEARRRAPLFGGRIAGRITAAVRQVDGDGIVELFGGYSAGIGVNTELRLVTADKAAAPLRLRVIREEGLNFSYAEVIQGNAADIKGGMLFEVDRWAPPEGSSLRVWIPRSALSLGALREFAVRMSALRLSARLQWVDDPTVTSPSHVLGFESGEWKLATVGGSAVSLGASPSADVVVKALPSGGKSLPRLFVYLPAAAEVIRDLPIGGDTQNNSIVMAPSADSAHFALVGRASPAGIQYSWIRPGVSMEGPAVSKAPVLDVKKGFREEARPAEIPLPIRTDWFPENAGGAEKNPAGELELSALNLGRLYAWLTLSPPPPDSSSYVWPWKMAFKRVSDGAIVDAGVLRGGEQYSLVFRATPEDLTGIIRQRAIYLLGIDAHGCGSVLFPATKSAVENRFPSPTPEGRWPLQFELTHPGKNSVFDVRKPYGVDTYILLTSEAPLPDPTVLQLDCVRTRSRPSRQGTTPLEKLLIRVGSTTRSGPAAATPKDWSLQRLVLPSVAP